MQKHTLQQVAHRVRNKPLLPSCSASVGCARPNPNPGAKKLQQIIALAQCAKLGSPRHFGCPTTAASSQLQKHDSAKPNKSHWQGQDQWNVASGMLELQGVITLCDQGLGVLYRRLWFGSLPEVHLHMNPLAEWSLALRTWELNHCSKHIPASKAQLSRGQQTISCNSTGVP